MADEILNPSTKKQDSTPFIMHVMRRMGQSAAAIVSLVEGQVVCSKKVVAGAVHQIIAITAYLQPRAPKSIFLVEGERQILTRGETDMEYAGNESSLGSDGKLDMKVFREVEGARKPEIDGPATIDER
jgi:hypothetical protein